MDQDLFGDSDSDREQDTEIKNDKIEESIEEERDELFGSDDEQETAIEAKLPLIETPLPDNKNLFLVKLPNFLAIESQHFDVDNYQDSAEEEEEIVSPLISKKVENKLRWRYNPTKGNKESNGHLVKWSDGSFSLLVGEELFEVATQPIVEKQNYLISSHPDEAIFKTQARLNNLMTFRPSSTQSLTHKKLTMAIAARHQKVGKAKVITTRDDPEKQQAEAIRLENERLKAKRKLENKQRQYRERELDAHDIGDIGYNRNVQDLERFGEYEDDDDFSLICLIIVDDDLDEQVEQERQSRLMEAKKAAPDSPERKDKLKRLRIEESDSE